MTKEEIGAILKQLRLSSSKTQKEVAESLGRTQQIVGHWETGYSQPDANTLFTLCEIYGTTVDNAFGFNRKSISLEDTKFLQKYHSLDDFGRETVNVILEREITRVKELSQKDARINELEAKPIIIEKHDDTMMRIYTYLRKIACAGNGFYFDDIPTETIEAPYLEGAEFIVGVNGDSMEPTYKDGDLVYVEKRQIIETGEIGIFIINNECFIKEAGEEGLISHNPKYPMIPGTENIQCIGKVLAKVPVLDN